MGENIPFSCIRQRTKELMTVRQIPFKMAKGMNRHLRKECIKRPSKCEQKLQ